MNIDVSATAFYEPGTVMSFFLKFLGRKGSEDNKLVPKVKDIERCERILKDVKVQITHRAKVKRKYKISGLTKTSADQTFFPYSPEKKDDEMNDISVAQYFEKKYNYILKYPNFPCVRIGTSVRHIFFPLEVCEIIPGQRFVRKLNEQQTAQMIRLACQAPDKRAEKISSAIAELGLIQKSSGGKDYLESYGFKINDQMMCVTARVLDPPTIQYHPSSKEPIIIPKEGAWNLRDKKVVQPAILHSWAVVSFVSPKDMSQQKVEIFLRELISTCCDTGLNITNPYPPLFFGDHMVNVEGTLRKAWQAAGDRVNLFPQLIFCILPSTNVLLYAEIKRVSDTILGIPTQCVQMKHVFQPKKQYCANVCLKINAKLGGVNSFVAKNPSVLGDEGLPWIFEVPSIVFGADMMHPSHGESKSTGSICALVGSLDSISCRYAASIRVQPPRKSIIKDLGSMVTDILKVFLKENSNIAPKRIIFYRDGVSNANIHELTSYEVNAIRKACEALRPGYKPLITFILVQKRHHARLFPLNSRDADKSGNIPAGTVIDNSITHPIEYDFFLCSHSGLQGTSRPTYYHVVHDDNSLSPNLIQELTYRLCYGYARCTRSVSVVPPAYYADLVAFRAKFHVKNSVYVNGGSLASASIKDESSRDDISFKFGYGESYIDPKDKKKKRRKELTKEEEEFMQQQLELKLASVKQELQGVMYFL
jgi:hypothetical protein